MRVRRGLALAVLTLAVIAATAFLAPRAGVPPRFWLSSLETVHVAGHELRVVRAADNAAGLMGVDSLGALDGMLFDHDAPRVPPAGMWMEDTLIPLDAAFFDPDGRLIEVITMPLCTPPSCPIYAPSRPYQVAIEGQAGAFAWMRPGDALVR